MHIVAGTIGNYTIRTLNYGTVVYWRHFRSNKIDLSPKCIICTPVTRITLLNGVSENTFHTKLSEGRLPIVDKALFYAFELSSSSMFIAAAILILLYRARTRPRDEHLSPNATAYVEFASSFEEGDYFWAVPFVGETVLANPLISEIYDAPVPFGARLQPFDAWLIPKQNWPIRRPLSTAILSIQRAAYAG